MRIGDWMPTYTGRKFYPLDPRVDEVAIEDIAHALSLICRFGGHCREFYSVAEHSVRCTLVLPSLPVLLHDATEAYLGDVIRPIKSSFPAYCNLEKVLAAVIERRFGIAPGSTSAPEVKNIDNLLLATEHRDIIPDNHAWAVDRTGALPDKILPWPGPVAENRFLQAFKMLSGKS